MDISCVIPTFRRDDTLAKAVASVLTQEVDAEFEVIVINDAGEPLSPASWQSDPRVRVYNTFRTERCVARNTGAALSRGHYLNFLDDDDIILPATYAALLQSAADRSGAWIQGAFEFVDEDDKLLDTLRPDTVGNVFALAVAGGISLLMASLIEREAFFSAGGFDSSFLTSEDAELFQRIAFRGTISVSSHVAARARFDPCRALKTSDVSLSRWDLHNEMGRSQREKAFVTAGCIREIRASLREHRDDLIRGRIIRYYVGSALRHARRGNLLTATSRLVVGVSLCLPCVQSARFLRGLRGGW